MKTKTKGEMPQANDREVIKRLDSMSDLLEVIATRLDVVVNLLMDDIPDERFTMPREFTSKLKHLDLTRQILLRPADAGRIFGRPSKDVSSRRKEIAAAKNKKKKTGKVSAKNQVKKSQSAEPA